MAELSARDRLILKWMIALMPLGGVGFYWLNVRPDQQTNLVAAQAQIDTLQAQVDTARADLQRGTVEQLRQRVADYEGTLGLMRQLVPTGDEVANLIDDISNRAKLRNVVVADLSPQSAEDDGAFRVARYRFTVLGRYDDIGGFLADIAALPRIMVPRDLGLSLANSNIATAVGDTSGTLLQASFMLRTFVKPQAPEQSAGGTGASQ